GLFLVLVRPLVLRPGSRHEAPQRRSTSSSAPCGETHRQPHCTNRPVEERSTSRLNIAPSIARYPKTMSDVKTTLIFVLIGALLGMVVASLVVPPALAWYTAPGGLPQGAQIQALVQIPEVIAYATGRLIRGQAVGAAIGAVVGLIVAVLAARRRPVRVAG